MEAYFIKIKNNYFVYDKCKTLNRTKCFSLVYEKDLRKINFIKIFCVGVSTLHITKPSQDPNVPCSELY